MKFTPAFWETFRHKWNEFYRTEFEPFGEIGSLHIMVMDFPGQSAEISWDNNGRIKKIVMHTEASARTFAATHKDWMNFLTRKKAAARLIMEKRMNFNGKASFLLKYGPYFEILSEIAGKVADLESITTKR